MRIAINGRLLIKNKLEGIGYFTWEVLKNMVRLYPEHDYLILFDRTPDRMFLETGVEFRVLRPAARHPVLYRIWFDLLVPLHLRMWDAEVFVSFDGFTSRNISIPLVTGIHDLAYLHYPEYMKSSDLRFYQKHQKTFARKSASIVTVSQFSAADIRNQYGINPTKIDVVYNGSRFEHNPPDQNLRVLDEYDLNAQRYVIYTGSLHPRKNITRLIQAFEMSNAAREHQIKLVLVGRKAWNVDEIFETINRSPLSARIVHTGYLPDPELWTLLRHALCLCYVSLFEGFGVPVLDAFHADVPVICSNSTSLQEVGAEAAYLVDEREPADIARAIDELYQKPGLRENLIAKGRQRRQMFGWKATTKKIFRSIERVWDASERGK